MNELVFSFSLHSCHYCGVLSLETGTFGFAPTYRDALRSLTHNPRNFWEYRKFLVNGYSLDLLDQPIIKGPYRFRTLRKHMVLTCPELLI